MFEKKVSSPKHVTDGKLHVKKTYLQVKACVTQAKSTKDLFRLLVTEQLNYSLKQMVIAYPNENL